MDEHMSDLDQIAANSGMSNLENALRNTYGIPVYIRHKLVRAYLGNHGAVQVPALIEEHAERIDPALLARLRILAANEDALV